MTRPALLVSVVSVRMIAAAAALLALTAILASCANTEEEVAPGDAASASSTHTPALSPSPLLTPSPPTDKVPADWATGTYLDFTFRYPANWYPETSGEAGGSTRIASFDGSLWKGGYPAGGIVVDLVRIDAAQAGPRPSEAADIVLGGLPGWQVVRGPGSEGGDGEWQKLHVFTVERNSYRYSVIAAFAEVDANETIVGQIVSTFKFTQ